MEEGEDSHEGPALEDGKEEAGPGTDDVLPAPQPRHNNGIMTYKNAYATHNYTMYMYLYIHSCKNTLRTAFPLS